MRPWAEVAQHWLRLCFPIALATSSFCGWERSSLTSSVRHRNQVLLVLDLGSYYSVSTKLDTLHCSRNKVHHGLPEKNYGVYFRPETPPLLVPLLAKLGRKTGGTFLHPLDHFVVQQRRGFFEGPCVPQTVWRLCHAGTLDALEKSPV